LEERDRKDLAVRHDDADVRAQCFDLTQDFANFDRLCDREIHCASALDDRRNVHFQSAACRPVRLRDYERDLVHARDRIERRNGELWGAEKNNAQGGDCIYALAGMRDEGGGTNAVIPHPSALSPKAEWPTAFRSLLSMSSA